MCYAMHYMPVRNVPCVYTGVNCIPVAYTARAEELREKQCIRQPRELRTLVLPLVLFCFHELILTCTNVCSCRAYATRFIPFRSGDAGSVGAVLCSQQDWLRETTVRVF